MFTIRSGQTDHFREAMDAEMQAKSDLALAQAKNSMNKKLQDRPVNSCCKNLLYTKDWQYCPYCGWSLGKKEGFERK